MEIIKQYRNEIDGLRAIAIIAIIVNHINSNFLPSGYLGVDIFFVISGYLITISLNKNDNKQFKTFLSDFYIKRVKRIFPALIVFVLVTSLLITLVDKTPHNYLRTGIASLFGISNIYTYTSSLDYFSQSALYNPFLHTWSLGIEQQFYLIFPFIAWFTGFSKDSKKGSFNFSIFILLISFISFFIFAKNYDSNQPVSYYLIIARFWEISLGILVYLISLRNSSFKERLLKILPTNILFIFLIFIFFIPTKYAVINTLSTTFLTILIIISIERNSLSYKLLTFSCLKYIGKISYSLYLWHWGILAIARWTIGISIYNLPFLIFLIFLCSSSSFYFIEEKYRKTLVLNKLLFSFKNIFLIFLSQIIIFYIGTYNKIIFAGNNTNKEYTYDKKVNKILFNRCNLSRTNFNKKLKNEECGFRENYSKTKKSIFIVGDSFSKIFYQAFLSLYKNRFNIISANGNNCEFPLRNKKTIDSNCAKNMIEVEKFLIDNTKKGDLVFITNLGLYEAFFDFVRTKSIKKEADIDFYLKNLNNFARVLGKNGTKTYFFVNSFIFPSVGDSYCSEEWFRQNTKIPKECFIEKSSQNIIREKFIKYLDEKTTFINPASNYTHLQCKLDICDASGYFDSTHFDDDLALSVLKELNLFSGKD